jgi:hypothetical protein
VRQRPDPAPELHQERIVEPEPGMDAPDVLVSRNVASDDRGRIAGRKVEQREHHERDHRHHDEGREQAPDDVGDHPPPGRLDVSAEAAISSRRSTSA